jgi:hypothetical protein
MKQQAYDARAALLILPPAEVAAVAEQMAAAAAVGVPATPSSTQPAGMGPNWPGFGSSQAEKTAADGKGHTEEGPSPVSGIMSSLENVPKVVVQVIGQATNSALAIEPALLDLGTVRVGYTEHRTIRLLNQSGGVLRYRLEVVNEEPHGVEAGAAGVVFAPAGEGEHAGQDAWVNEPEGVVGSR